MNVYEPSILIVDDSVTTRAMIKRVIRMTNLPVGQLHEAGDGQAALDLMKANSIDLVFADLNMPVLDGFALIARMRLNPALRGIPVIVISAHPDIQQMEQLRKNGVAGYLSKPFTPEAVRDTLTPVLDALHASRKAALPTEAAPVNLNLAEALAEALETMAFISPVLQQAGASAGPDNPYVVHVDFHGGGERGRLMIAAPREFGGLIASNCDAPDSLAAANDALKELANIACGLLLRKRIGGAAGFELMPPVLDTNEALGDAWVARGFTNPEVVHFDADGHPICAELVNDSPTLLNGTRL